MESSARPCLRQGFRRLVFWVALLDILIAAGGLCHAQQAATEKKQIVISVDRFQLLAQGKEFFLQSTSAGKKRLQIPREWLIPAQEEKDEEDAPVSSFRYDPQVTSFAIGNGEIGIRLSSYDMMREGSLQAAEGRDVFLIFDPAAGKVRPGHVDFGITKERYHAERCWYATMTHFLISDKNQDGLTDLGVIKEEIRCPKGEDVWEGDSYEQHPLHWYLYSADGWKREEYDSGWPDTYAELPLVGITLSPVDFVGHGLWNSYDPANWKTPPHYLPSYRKEMIANELRQKSSSSPKP